MPIRFTVLALGIILNLGLLATPSGPNQSYDNRVAVAWNSFQEESKLWTAVVNSQLTYKQRSKMEKDRFERMKEKWALVMTEVESLP